MEIDGPRVEQAFHRGVDAVEGFREALGGNRFALDADALGGLGEVGGSE